MDRQEKLQPLQRKKLWEIDDCFKCAVIGTCLSRGELRKLGREKVFAVVPGYDDYQLHSHFITIAGQQDLKGKTLHKYLEKKYRNDTRKYFRVTTDAEIAALWREDLAVGRVAGGWWAIMTHPLASADLVSLLYREIHMLGHDCVANFHKKQVLIKDLHAKVASLEEVLGSERQLYLQEKRRFMEEVAGLAMEIDGKAAIARENRTQQEVIARQSEQIIRLTAARQDEPERQRNEQLHRLNTTLSGRIAELTEELEALSRHLAIAREKVRVMEDRYGRIEQHKADQAAEIAVLEGMLHQQLAGSSPCLTCADQHTGKCPGQDLCGRTVLYVGGLHKMVPHYRQLVENLGGRFIHHDGGKEVSRNLLPKMLITADAVFCPIDCVSHDACNCVKKLCKRFRKPFVLMRSASLSSLAKGLKDIVQ